ncbi:MAG: DNA repair protein RecO [Candidatus Omnitrophota bacterium]|nr:MAG: DNA repair protein RecO [Candidatus Omnitrophota bacterium]
MAIQKSEAIVLKTSDFRETSLVVNLFTKDFGKLGGLIKGIRLTPQRYGGMPLIFSRSSIVFYQNPKRDLSLVTQCDAQEQFLPIREDLEKTAYANYFLELLDTVTQDYDKNERLFELTVDALRALCHTRESWRIARIFEIRLLNFSGFKPRLDSCVNCQKEIVQEARLKTGGQGRFSSILGGILCERCFGHDKNAQATLKGTLASIEYIEKSDWSKALRLKIAPDIAAELVTILNSFLDIHLDKEIKSRKFLH